MNSATKDKAASFMDEFNKKAEAAKKKVDGIIDTDYNPKDKSKILDKLEKSSIWKNLGAVT